MPSAPIFFKPCPFVPSFVFAVLFIPSINVLSGCVLHNFVAALTAHCLNFDKFRDNIHRHGKTSTAVREAHFLAVTA